MLTTCMGAITTAPEPIAKITTMMNSGISTRSAVARRLLAGDVVFAVTVAILSRSLRDVYPVEIAGELRSELGEAGTDPADRVSDGVDGLVMADRKRDV